MTEIPDGEIISPEEFYSASCHFEAAGREIPRAQQVKVAWLDKIYGQNPPYYQLLIGKSKVLGISPFGRNDTACVMWMLEQLLEDC
ncbi:MAG: hypothetical protein HYR94_30355 [Chloroflexi bacterium]|nr:hypothetical protein [Chloroflexota bacterium]